MQEPPLILIVDDDESVRQAVTSLMRAVGFHTETFASAQDFLGSDNVQRAICLIVDMQMPGMTGLELHTHMRAAGCSIPTILITAYPDDRVRTRALQAGIMCYLAKPFSEDEILKCIFSVLPDREAGRHG